MSLNIEAPTISEVRELPDPTRLYWDDTKSEWKSQDRNIRVVLRSSTRGGSPQWEGLWLSELILNQPYYASVGLLSTVAEASYEASTAWNKEWA